MNLRTLRQQPKPLTITRILSSLWCLVVGHGWLTNYWFTNSLCESEVVVQCVFCDRREVRVERSRS